MGAIISSDEKYRYLLTREWSEGSGAVLFIGLNPSTADAEKDDPTVRRLISFAKAWGYRELLLGNLFALRSTDPKVLLTAQDPVGSENDGYLRNAALLASKVVACWGANGGLLGRNATVREAFAGQGLHHLGLTKEGHPRHPLYLRRDTPLEVWT